MTSRRFVYWALTGLYCFILMVLLWAAGYVGIALATPTIPATAAYIRRWHEGRRLQRALKRWLAGNE